MERKKCISCDKPLIAFQNHYLHPETSCAGLLDYIEIEATISDEFLNEKFEKLYGKPILNDYERIDVLEEKIKELSFKEIFLEEQIKIKNKMLNKPFIKLFLKFSK